MFLFKVIVYIGFTRTSVNDIFRMYSINNANKIVINLMVNVVVFIIAQSSSIITQTKSSLP